MTVRWIAVVHLLAAGSLGATAVVAWRRREAPAANWFALLAGTLAVGAAIIAATVAATVPRLSLVWTTVALGLTVPVPWLFFCLAYTGRTEFTSARIAGTVSILPVGGFLATTAIFGTQFVPGLRLPAQGVATGLAALVVAVLNSLQWLALFYAGGLVFVGAGLLLWTFDRYEYLDSSTGALLGTLGTVPWLSVLFGLQLDRTSPWALPWIVGLGLLVGGLVAAGALGPHRLFDRVPAAGNAGPATVVEDLPDLVVVTDSTGSIVELNDVARRTLGPAAARPIGTAVSEVLGSGVEALRAAETVELPVGQGRGLFEPTVSALTDQQGRGLGHAIVLRDVTERRLRQQRLEVFNRVLRHNLRNRMTVALGNADNIRDAADDPEIAERAAAIVDAAEELTTLSAQAREVESVMAGGDAETGPTPLETLVEDVFRDLERPGVTFTSDLPAGVVVEESADALALALTNLVENAIKHNDAADPTVEVRASYETDRRYPLSIAVADDGPGLPEHEVAAIEAGRESALEHASGLGLWVVRWVATHFDGDVAFRHRDPRGTVVELRLGRGASGATDRPPATPDGHLN
jgi:signal transduction histidine kinase